MKSPLNSFTSFPVKSKTFKSLIFLLIKNVFFVGFGYTEKFCVSSKSLSDSVAPLLSKVSLNNCSPGKPVQSANPAPENPQTIKI